MNISQQFREIVTAIVSLDLVPLSSFPVNYCTQTVNSVRLCMHDLMLRAYFDSLNEFFQDEKSNDILSFCTRNSLHVKASDISLDDLKKTPDIVLYTGTKVVVEDFTFTESSVETAKERKILKYLYWRNIDCEVEVNAIAIKRSLPEAILFLTKVKADKFYHSRINDLFRVYNSAMDTIREHPDFLAIYSELNGGDSKPKPEFVVPDVDFGKVPIDVINRLFGSESIFHDYLTNKNIFRGYTHDSIEDSLFENRVVDHLSPLIDDILSTSNEKILESSVSHIQCIEAADALVEEYKKIPATTKTMAYSKIIPIPMLRLTPSLTPKIAAVEALKSLKFCPEDNNYFITKIMICASSVFDSESTDVFIGGFKTEGSDLKTVKTLFANKQAVQYRSKNCKVLEKRTLRFNFDGIEAGFGSVVAKAVGIGYLDYFGKDGTKQKDLSSHLEWDTSLTKLYELRNWMISEGSAVSDAWLSDLTVKTSRPLSDDIRSESLLHLYSLFASVKRTNVFALANFYDQVYKEIAFLAEKNTKKSDISFSTIGSEDAILLVYGGQQLSRLNSKRYISIIKVLSIDDDFPFNSSSPYQVFKSVKGEQLLILDPISVDCLTVAHHMITKKFVYDVCLGLILDSSKTLPLSLEDRIFYFFTNTILRFSNDKSSSDLVMDVRYIFMALNSVRSKLVKMTRKIVSPCRKLLSLYFYKMIYQGLIEWHNSNRATTVSMTNEDSEELKTRALFTRLLGPGVNTGIDEGLIECYIYSAVSKETRNRYHAMAAAFNKLTESSSKYYKNYETDASLVRGFSESDPFNLKVLTGTGLTTFSAKASDYVGKMLRDSVPISKIKKDILTGKLSASVSEFATNKSMVKDRLSMTLKEEYETSLKKTVRVKRLIDGVVTYAKEERLVINSVPKTHRTVMKGRAKEYEWLNGCADLKDAVCDMKTKAIVRTVDYVHDSNNTSISSLISDTLTNWFQCYFTLFPKNQWGRGGREIAIQDFQTRISNFFIERVAESICKCLEEETITKSASKYFTQEKKTNEFINRNYVIEKNADEADYRYKAFFLNQDHTRWGPSSNVLQFIFLMRPILESIDVKIFRLVLFNSLRMMDKRIELPREIFKSWSSTFDVSKADPFQLSIIEQFKATGEVTFGLVIGMMQGICNLSSSLNAVARCRITRRLLDRLQLKHNFEIQSTNLVGSDDKETIASARINANSVRSTTDFKCDLIRNILIYECVDNTSAQLLNMEVSDAKSGGSVRIGEYNSNFIMDRSTVSRRYIEYGSLSFNCKAISYGSDVSSGFNGIVSICQSGITEVNCLLFQLTLKEHIDSIYNFGSGKTRDIEAIFKCKREFIPVELGGFPILTSLELITGFKHNSMSKVIENGSIESKRSLYRLISPKNSMLLDLETDDYAEELTSSIGLNYVVRMKSRVGNITNHFVDRYSLSHDIVKERILSEPWLPFVDPISPEDFKLKMANRIFSFQSKVAFSYENDISNMIRMARMSSSKVTYIGPHMEKSKIDPSLLEDFITTVRKFTEESLSTAYDEEIELSTAELNRLLMSNDSFCILKEYSSDHILARQDGITIQRQIKYRRSTRNVILSVKPVNSRNKLLNVVINKWFDTSNERSRNLIINENYADRDFQKIQTRYDFVKETVSETAICLFGFSNLESNRAAFNTIVTILRSADRGKLKLLSNVNRNYIDDEFLRLWTQRNMFVGREYAIVRRNCSHMREDATRENYTKSLEQLSSSIASGLIYIQHSSTSKDQMYSLGKVFLNNFSSSILSTLPLSLTKTQTYCSSFSEALTKIPPSVFMSLNIPEKLQKSLVCAANVISIDLGNDYESEYQAYHYAISVWYVKEQNKIKGAYDVTSDCSVGVTYKSDKHLMVTSKNGIKTVRLDRNDWGTIPDLTIPLKVIINNTFNEDICKNTKECLDKPIPDQFFTKLDKKPDTSIIMVYEEGNRLYACDSKYISLGKRVLKDCVVSLGRVATSNTIKFSQSFSGLVESETTFSLGRMVGDRFVSVYDVSSQLFDPASLLYDGPRNIGILGEIETVFSESGTLIKLDELQLNIPILASKLNLSPEFSPYTIVPDNWEEEQSDSTESVHGNIKMESEDGDSDFDFDDFNMNIEGSSSIIENYAVGESDDFYDVTSIVLGKSAHNSKGKIRFTEAYVNIVRRIMSNYPLKNKILEFSDRLPSWSQNYYMFFLSENCKALLNNDMLLETYKTSKKSQLVLNSCLCHLMTSRMTFPNESGESLTKMYIENIKIFTSKNIGIHSNTFERFFGSGRDQTVEHFLKPRTGHIRKDYFSSETVDDDMLF